MNDRTAETKIGSQNTSTTGTRSSPSAADHVGPSTKSSWGIQVRRPPWARVSGMTAMWTASSGVIGAPRASTPIVGLHGGRMTGRPGPTTAANRGHELSRVRVAVREDALEERVVADVHVSDDGEVVPGGERRLVARGDLHVDRLEGREPPGGLVIGELRGGAGADRRRIGVGEHPAEPVVQLLDRLAHLRRELHERPHRPASAPA